MFFKKGHHGNLKCLPKNAPYSLIMTADSEMLKLDNQKNGWKGVCVPQEANGEHFKCLCRHWHSGTTICGKILPMEKHSSLL